MPGGDPTPAAERMRRARERRRDGKVIARIELTPHFIDHLVDLGWLTPERKSSAVAVTRAFFDFAQCAYDASQTNAADFRAPATGDAQ
jgi:hypothetical protein